MLVYPAKPGLLLRPDFTVVYHCQIVKELLPIDIRRQAQTYIRMFELIAWWSQAGSNRRPPACKAGALPAELWPPKDFYMMLEVVGLGRVELPTSPLSGVRSNQLSYRPTVTRNSFDQTGCVGASYAVMSCFFKGGDPAAGSPTATLLRLHPSHEPHRGDRSPEG